MALPIGSFAPPTAQDLADQDAFYDYVATLPTDVQALDEIQKLIAIERPWEEPLSPTTFTEILRHNETSIDYSIALKSQASRFGAASTYTNTLTDKAQDSAKVAGLPAASSAPTDAITQDELAWLTALDPFPGSLTDEDLTEVLTDPVLFAAYVAIHHLEQAFQTADGEVFCPPEILNAMSPADAFYEVLYATYDPDGRSWEQAMQADRALVSADQDEASATAAAAGTSPLAANVDDELTAVYPSFTFSFADPQFRRWLYDGCLKIGALSPDGTLHVRRADLAAALTNGVFNTVRVSARQSEELLELFSDSVVFGQDGGILSGVRLEGQATDATLRGWTEAFFRCLGLSGKSSSQVNLGDAANYARDKVLSGGTDEDGLRTLFKEIAQAGPGRIQGFKHAVELDFKAIQTLVEFTWESPYAHRGLSFEELLKADVSASLYDDLMRLFTWSERGLLAYDTAADEPGDAPFYGDFDFSLSDPNFVRWLYDGCTRLGSVQTDGSLVVKTAAFQAAVLDKRFNGVPLSASQVDTLDRLFTADTIVFAADGRIVSGVRSDYEVQAPTAQVKEWVEGFFSLCHNFKVSEQMAGDGFLNFMAERVYDYGTDEEGLEALFRQIAAAGPEAVRQFKQAVELNFKAISAWEGMGQSFDELLASEVSGRWLGRLRMILISAERGDDYYRGRAYGHLMAEVQDLQIAAAFAGTAATGGAAGEAPDLAVVVNLLLDRGRPYHDYAKRLILEGMRGPSSQPVADVNELDEATYERIVRDLAAQGRAKDLGVLLQQAITAQLSAKITDYVAVLGLSATDVQGVEPKVLIALIASKVAMSLKDSVDTWGTTADIGWGHGSGQDRSYFDTAYGEFESRQAALIDAIRHHQAIDDEKIIKLNDAMTILYKEFDIFEGQEKAGMEQVDSSFQAAEMGAYIAIGTVVATFTAGAGAAVIAGYAAGATTLSAAAIGGAGIMAAGEAGAGAIIGGMGIGLAAGTTAETAAKYIVATELKNEDVTLNQFAEMAHSSALDAGGAVISLGVGTGIGAAARGLNATAQASLVAAQGTSAIARTGSLARLGGSAARVGAQILNNPVGRGFISNTTISAANSALHGFEDFGPDSLLIAGASGIFGGLVNPLLTNRKLAEVAFEMGREVGEGLAETQFGFKDSQGVTSEVFIQSLAGALAELAGSTRGDVESAAARSFTQLTANVMGAQGQPVSGVVRVDVLGKELSVPVTATANSNGTFTVTVPDGTYKKATTQATVTEAIAIMMQSRAQSLITGAMPPTPGSRNPTPVQDPSTPTTPTTDTAPPTTPAASDQGGTTTPSDQDGTVSAVEQTSPANPQATSGEIDTTEIGASKSQGASTQTTQDARAILSLIAAHQRSGEEQALHTLPDGSVIRASGETILATDENGDIAADDSRTGTVGVRQELAAEILALGDEEDGHGAIVATSDITLHTHTVRAADPGVGISSEDVVNATIQSADDVFDLLKRVQETRAALVRQNKPADSVVLTRTTVAHVLVDEMGQPVLNEHGEAVMAALGEPVVMTLTARYDGGEYRIEARLAIGDTTRPDLATVESQAILPAAFMQGEGARVRFTATASQALASSTAIENAFGRQLITIGQAVYAWNRFARGQDSARSEPRAEFEAIEETDSNRENDGDAQGFTQDQGSQQGSGERQAANNNDYFDGGQIADDQAIEEVAVPDNVVSLFGDFQPNQTRAVAAGPAEIKAWALAWARARLGKPAQPPPHAATGDKTVTPEPVEDVPTAIPPFATTTVTVEPDDPEAWLAPFQEITAAERQAEQIGDRRFAPDGLEFDKPAVPAAPVDVNKARVSFLTSWRHSPLLCSFYLFLNLTTEVAEVFRPDPDRLAGEVAADAGGVFHPLSEVVGVASAGLRAKHGGFDAESRYAGILAGEPLKPLVRALKQFTGVTAQDVSRDIHQSGDVNRSVVELISNSLDAGREARDHDVHVTLTNGFLEVLDRGKGMAEKILIERFLIPKLTGKQTDAGEIGGFGIGFYTVLRHLKKNGDQVVVETKTANGEAYRIVFLHKNGKTLYRSERLTADTDQTDFFAAIAGKPDPSESRHQAASGTRIRVYSADIDPARIADKIYEYDRHISPERALLLNGRRVNPLTPFETVATDGDTTIRFNPDGPSSVTILVGDVVTEQHAYHGTAFPGELIVALPAGTDRLSITRDNIKVDERMLATFERMLAIADDDTRCPTPRAKLAHLNTLVPLARAFEANRRNTTAENFLARLRHKAQPLIAANTVYPDRPGMRAALGNRTELVFAAPEVMEADALKAFTVPPEFKGGHVVVTQGEPRPIHVVLSDDLTVSHHFDPDSGVFYLSRSTYERSSPAVLTALFRIPNLEFYVHWDAQARQRSTSDATSTEAAQTAEAPDPRRDAPTPQTTALPDGPVASKTTATARNTPITTDELTAASAFLKAQGLSPPVMRIGHVTVNELTRVKPTDRIVPVTVQGQSYLVDMRYNVIRDRGGQVIARCPPGIALQRPFVDQVGNRLIFQGSKDGKDILLDSKFRPIPMDPKYHWIEVIPRPDCGFDYIVTDENGKRGVLGDDLKPLIPCEQDTVEWEIHFGGKNVFKVWETRRSDVQYLTAKNAPVIPGAPSGAKCYTPLHQGIPRPVFKYFQDGKWRLMNVNGEVLPAEYDQVHFNNNLIIATQGGRTTFLDPVGNELGAFPYPKLNWDGCGRTQFSNFDGQGFAAGEFVTLWYSQGRLLFVGLEVCYDQDGNIVFSSPDIDYLSVVATHDGETFFVIRHLDGTESLLDGTFQTIIPKERGYRSLSYIWESSPPLFHFTSAKDFNSSTIRGVVTLEGHEVSQPDNQLTDKYPFSVFNQSDRRKGLTNIATGEVILPAIYESIKFENGQIYCDEAFGDMVVISPRDLARLADPVIQARVVQLRGWGLAPADHLDAVLAATAAAWQAMIADPALHRLLPYLNNPLCNRYLTAFPGRTAAQYETAFRLIAAFGSIAEAEPERFVVRIHALTLSNLDITQLLADAQALAGSPDLAAVEVYLSSDVHLREQNQRLPALTKPAHPMADVMTHAKMGGTPPKTLAAFTQVPRYDNEQDARVLDQAVHHLGHGNPMLYLRELFQNCLDATKRTRHREDRRVEIDYYSHQGALHVSFRDYGGMSEREFVQDFLMPERSSKRSALSEAMAPALALVQETSFYQNAVVRFAPFLAALEGSDFCRAVLDRALPSRRTRGEHGIGFLSSLADGEWVRVRTARSGSREVLYAEFQVRRQASGVSEIVNLKLDKRSNDDGFYGTHIETRRHGANMLLDAARSKVILEDMVAYIDADEAEIVLNGETANSKRERLAMETWPGVGRVELYDSPQNKILLDNLPFADIDDAIWQGLPEGIREFYQRHGIALNLHVASTPTRDRFVDHDAVMLAIRDNLPSILIRGYLERVRDPARAADLSMIPEVYFVEAYSLAKAESLGKDILADAARINAGKGGVDYTKYHDRRELVKLLTVVNFIPLPHGRGTMSIRDLYQIANDPKRRTELAALAPTLPQALAKRLQSAEDVKTAQNEGAGTITAAGVAERVYPADHAAVAPAYGLHLQLVQEITRMFYPQGAVHVGLNTHVNEIPFYALHYQRGRDYHLYRSFNRAFHHDVRELVRIAKIPDEAERVRQFDSYVADVIEIITHELTHVYTERTDDPNFTHDAHFYRDQMAILLNGQRVEIDTAGLRERFLTAAAGLEVTETWEEAVAKLAASGEPPAPPPEPDRGFRPKGEAVVDPIVQPETSPGPIKTALLPETADDTQQARFSNDSDAQRHAIEMTRSRGTEHTIFRDDKGGFTVVEGDTEAAVTSLFGGAAALGENEFFGITIFGHTHPPGFSPLPSRADMEVLATDALQRGIALTTRTMGFDAHGGTIQYVLHADVIDGRVQLGITDEAGDSIVQGSNETAEVIVEMRAVETLLQNVPVGSPAHVVIHNQENQPRIIGVPGRKDLGLAPSQGALSEVLRTMVTANDPKEVAFSTTTRILGVQIRTQRYVIRPARNGFRVEVETIQITDRLTGGTSKNIFTIERGQVLPGTSYKLDYSWVRVVGPPRRTASAQVQNTAVGPVAGGAVKTGPDVTYERYEPPEPNYSAHPNGPYQVDIWDVHAQRSIERAVAWIRGREPINVLSEADRTILLTQKDTAQATKILVLQDGTYQVTSTVVRVSGPSRLYKEVIAGGSIYYKWYLPTQAESLAGPAWESPVQYFRIGTSASVVTVNQGSGKLARSLTLRANPGRAFAPRALSNNNAAHMIAQGGDNVRCALISLINAMQLSAIRHGGKPLEKTKLQQLENAVWLATCRINRTDPNRRFTGNKSDSTGLAEVIQGMNKILKQSDAPVQMQSTTLSFNQAMPIPADVTDPRRHFDPRRNPNLAATVGLDEGERISASASMYADHGIAIESFDLASQSTRLIDQMNLDETVETNLPFLAKNAPSAKFIFFTFKDEKTGQPIPITEVLARLPYDRLTGGESSGGSSPQTIGGKSGDDDMTLEPAPWDREWCEKDEGTATEWNARRARLIAEGAPRRVPAGKAGDGWPASQGQIAHQEPGARLATALFNATSASPSDTIAILRATACEIAMQRGHRIQPGLILPEPQQYEFELAVVLDTATGRILADPGQDQRSPTHLPLRYTVYPQRHALELDAISRQGLFPALRVATDPAARAALTALLRNPAIDLALAGRPVEETALLAHNQGQVRELCRRSDVATLYSTWVAQLALDYGTFRMGTIHFDIAGRIQGGELTLPLPQTARGNLHAAGIMMAGGALEVVVHKGVILHMGSLDHLNPAQRAAITALWDSQTEARAGLERDYPFAADIILERGLAPLWTALLQEIRLSRPLQQFDVTRAKDGALVLRPLDGQAVAPTSGPAEIAGQITLSRDPSTSPQRFETQVAGDFPERAEIERFLVWLLPRMNADLQGRPEYSQQPAPDRGFRPKGEVVSSPRNPVLTATLADLGIPHSAWKALYANDDCEANLIRDERSGEWRIEAGEVRTVHLSSFGDEADVGEIDAWFGFEVIGHRHARGEQQACSSPEGPVRSNIHPDHFIDDRLTLAKRAVNSPTHESSGIVFGHIDDEPAFVAVTAHYDETTGTVWCSFRPSENYPVAWRNDLVSIPGIPRAQAVMGHMARGRMSGVSIAAARQTLTLGETYTPDDVIAAYSARRSERVHANLLDELLLYQAVHALVAPKDLVHALEMNAPLGRAAYLYHHSPLGGPFPFAEYPEHPYWPNIPYHSEFLGPFADNVLGNGVLEMLWSVNDPELFSDAEQRRIALQNRATVAAALKEQIDKFGLEPLLGFLPSSRQTREVLDSLGHAGALESPNGDSEIKTIDDWIAASSFVSPGPEAVEDAEASIAEIEGDIRANADDLKSVRAVFKDDLAAYQHFLQAYRETLAQGLRFSFTTLLQRCGSLDSTVRSNLLRTWGEASNVGRRRIFSLYWLLTQVEEARFEDAVANVIHCAHSNYFEDPMAWTSIRSQFLSYLPPQQELDFSAGAFTLYHQTKAERAAGISQRGFAAIHAYQGRERRRHFYHSGGITTDVPNDVVARFAGGSGMYFGLDTSIDWYSGDACTNIQFDLPKGHGLRVFDMRRPEHMAYYHRWLYMSEANVQSYAPQDSPGGYYDALRLRSSIADQFAAEHGIDAIIRVDNDHGNYVEFIAKSTKAYDVINQQRLVMTSRPDPDTVPGSPAAGDGPASGDPEVLAAWSRGVGQLFDDPTQLAVLAGVAESQPVADLRLAAEHAIRAAVAPQTVNPDQLAGEQQRLAAMDQRFETWLAAQGEPDAETMRRRVQEFFPAAVETRLGLTSPIVAAGNDTIRALYALALIHEFLLERENLLAAFADGPYPTLLADLLRGEAGTTTANTGSCDPMAVLVLHYGRKIGLPLGSYFCEGHVSVHVDLLGGFLYEPTGGVVTDPAAVAARNVFHHRRLFVAAGRAPESAPVYTNPTPAILRQPLAQAVALRPLDEASPLINLQAMRLAVAMTPEDSQAWTALAENLYRMEDDTAGDHRTEAAEAIDRAIALHPQNTRALVLKAAILIDQQDFSAAVNFLARAGEADQQVLQRARDGNPAANTSADTRRLFHYQAGRLWDHSRADLAQAWNHYAQAFQQTSGETTNWRRLIATDFADATLRLAESRQQAGRTNEALAAINQAVDMFATDGRFDPAYEGMFWQAGLLNWGAGDYQRAGDIWLNMGAIGHANLVGRFSAFAFERLGQIAAVESSQEAQVLLQIGEVLGVPLPPGNPAPAKRGATTPPRITPLFNGNFRRMAIELDELVAGIAALDDVFEGTVDSQRMQRRMNRFVEDLIDLQRRTGAEAARLGVSGEENQARIDELSAAFMTRLLGAVRDRIPGDRNRQIPYGREVALLDCLETLGEIAGSHAPAQASGVEAVAAEIRSRGAPESRSHHTDGLVPPDPQPISDPEVAALLDSPELRFRLEQQARRLWGEINLGLNPDDTLPLFMGGGEAEFYRDNASGEWIFQYGDPERGDMQILTLDLDAQGRPRGDIATDGRAAASQYSNDAGVTPADRRLVGHWHGINTGVTPSVDDLIRIAQESGPAVHLITSLRVDADVAAQDGLTAALRSATLETAVIHRDEHGNITLNESLVPPESRRSLRQQFEGNLATARAELAAGRVSGPRTLAATKEAKGAPRRVPAGKAGDGWPLRAPYPTLVPLDNASHADSDKSAEDVIDLTINASNVSFHPHGTGVARTGTAFTFALPDAGAAAGPLVTIPCDDSMQHLEIGRDPSAHLQIVAGVISRRHHATLDIKDGACWIVAMRSAGVWINGVECMPGRSYRLKIGDRVALGRPQNELVFGAVSGPPTSPADTVLAQRRARTASVPLGPRAIRLSDPLLNANTPLDPGHYGTTAALLMGFESGGEVWEREYTPRHGPAQTVYSYVPMGSGQAGTIDPYPSNREEFEAYQRWQAERGIRPRLTDKVDVGGPASPQFRGAAAHLARTLTAGGVPHRHMPQGSPDATGHSLRVLTDAVSALPDCLLNNGYLQGIDIASRSRIQAATMSAYENGWVHIYRMMHQAGGVRNLTLLATHEIGHSTAERYGGAENRPDAAIPAEIRDRMHRAHQTITAAKGHFGLDYCGGPAYRKAYQGSFIEFIAEMHPIYVYAGDALRAHIAALPSGSPEREAWGFVYAEFRDRIFGGREYTFGELARANEKPPPP